MKEIDDYTQIINICDDIYEKIKKADLVNISNTLQYIREKIRDIECICCSDI